MVNEVVANEVEAKGLLFTLKEISYSPTAPRMSEPFTVKGKIKLFTLPFFGPIWVIATVTYPETWWEEIIPIIGSPEIREDTTALGGNFEVTFKKGFEREGEFKLAVRAYGGPTKPLDTMTLPPFPPVATEETTFTVAGEISDEELGFRNLVVVSYAKNGGTPVTSPGVLELAVGDKCQVKVSFEHKGDATTGQFYGAIGNIHTIPTEWFDEVLAAETGFGAPADADWIPYEGTVDIPITSAISPGSGYDLYVKILPEAGGKLISPFVDGVITISGGIPEGSITSKYINKAPEGNKIPLPTTVTADGNTFEVGVRAKNTSSVAYIGGVEVKVYDPDGTLRASPTIDYAGISPNEELTWEYNISKVDKAGSWTIEVRFLTEDGKVLAEEQAVMTATSVAAEYNGSITSKYINKAPEGNKIPLPTTVKADGNTFEVGVRAKNTSSASYVGGIEVKVYDPGGTLRASPTIDWVGISPNEELTWEYNACKVDKAGSWKIEVRFLEKSTSKVLATDQTTMTATEVAAEYKGSIVSKYINKSPEGSNISLPTSVKADGNTFEVGVIARNTATVAYVGGVKVEVYDPNGTLRASPAIDYTGIDPNKSLTWEYNACKVDKAGTWKIKISFLEKTTQTVLAQQETTMTATEVAVEYKGSITSKYINKSPEGNNISLPATVKADGNTFEVGVRAKNTSSAAYTAGVEVKVYDPGGTLRASPTIDWAGIDPGETLTWEYNICKVDKAGSWTIKIRFLEKTTSTVLAETQTTMTATEVTVEYKGSITSKYINKSPEGSRIELPTTVAADGNTFEVGVLAKNTSSAAYTAGVEVKVYDPGGTLRASPTVDYTGIDPGETLRWEYNICKVDKAGSWTIKIRFLEKTTAKVLAETQTTMTATAVAVSFKVYIKNYASIMPKAVSWACQYYDPVKKSFVDSGFHSLSEAASFKNVNPGGYLAALLYDGTNQTDWYYSPSFTAVNNGVYQYDIYNKTVTKTG